MHTYVFFIYVCRHIRPHTHTPMYMYMCMSVYTHTGVCMRTHAARAPPCSWAPLCLTPSRPALPAPQLPHPGLRAALLGRAPIQAGSRWAQRGWGQDCTCVNSSWLPQDPLLEAPSPGTQRCGGSGARGRCQPGLLGSTFPVPASWLRALESSLPGCLGPWPVPASPRLSSWPHCGHNSSQVKSNLPSHSLGQGRGGGYSQSSFSPQPAPHHFSCPTPSLPPSQNGE